MDTTKQTQSGPDLFWIIPSAIDLPQILKNHSPAFRYKIDYFHHLIELICNQMEYLDPAEKAKWVFLNAKKLQQFNKHYKRYLGYLQKVGIIKVDKQYVVGVRSRGYKLENRYTMARQKKFHLTNQMSLYYKSGARLKLH